MTINVSPDEAKRAQEAGGFAPYGRHLCEVVDDYEKMSASKHPGINIQLAVVGGEHEGLTACFDMLMLGGKGMGIGIVKLKALGENFDRNWRYESGNLRGRRVFVTTVERTYEKQDGTKGTAPTPLFDRDRGFGYEAVDGAVGTSSEPSAEVCVCEHAESFHPGRLKCSIQGCKCEAFDILPF